MGDITLIKIGGLQTVNKNEHFHNFFPCVDVNVTYLWEHISVGVSQCIRLVLRTVFNETQYPYAVSAHAQMSKLKLDQMLQTYY